MDDGALKNSYDAQKVADQQQLGAVAGYVGMRSVGAIAQYMQDHAATDEERAAWADGSRNKVILHGVVGAAMASLGGGSATQGAIGAASAEAASQAMQDYLASNGVTPGSEEWKTYMELGAAAIGGATGGASGATAGLDGELYNRQLHETEKQRIQALAGGDQTKEVRLTAAACALVHCSAEYAEGSPEYAYYSKLEAVGNGDDYAGDRQLLKDQSYQRMGVNGDGKATPVTEYLFTYDAGDRTSDGLSWFNNSYGHPFTRAGAPCRRLVAERQRLAEGFLRRVAPHLARRRLVPGAGRPS